MNSNLADQLTRLANEIGTGDTGANSDLTLFPSGGAMLDVRRRDGRAFVMAFTPQHGFAVDELQPDEGFVASYQFTFSDFESAAQKFQELVKDGTRSQVFAAPQLNLVVIYAQNLEATREFYASLGLSLQLEHHGNGPRHYAAALGGAVFEIYPHREGEQQGGLRIGFQVESVDGVLQQLRQRHVTILTEPRDSPWGRRAVVEDPNGNRVELSQKLVSVAS